LSIQLNFLKVYPLPIGFYTIFYETKAKSKFGLGSNENMFGVIFGLVVSVSIYRQIKKTETIFSIIAMFMLKNLAIHLPQK
jgi:hypothetical protein